MYAMDHFLKRAEGLLQAVDQTAKAVSSGKNGALIQNIGMFDVLYTYNMFTQSKCCHFCTWWTS